MISISGPYGPRQANLVLIAYASSESRGISRQKARSLAPLNGWECATLFVGLRFYVPDSTIKIMSSRSVNLLTLFLGRLSGYQYLGHMQRGGGKAECDGRR